MENITLKSILRFIFITQPLFLSHCSKNIQKRIPIAALFFLFLSLSLRVDYEVMEMNYGKPKEDFIHNRLIHKNLPQFYNNCYHLKDSNSSLWPIFQGLKNLIIYCFSHKFPSHIPINIRGIFKKKERFVFITDSFTKTSLCVCTSNLDRVIWMHCWDPNFPKSGLLFLG